MSISTALLFSNLFDDVSDEQMYRYELERALRAEAMGFDAIWAVEHHFDSYSMCPNNIQLMSWIAGKTTTIKLGLGAVILPWHDPLRVIENVTMLDIMSEGRVLLGFGRGLARMEYDGFRQKMDESRERFDEAALFVLQALETGVAEFHGKFYDQPRVDVRPRPPRSFKGRLYGVAMSPESVIPVAEMGAVMMAFPQGDIESMLPAINAHRSVYLEKHGVAPPPVKLTDFTYCHEDAAEAERMIRKHLAAYFMSVMRHYDMMGSGFEGVKGYASYANAAAEMQKMGMDAVLEKYINSQIWGTPEQIYNKFKARYDAAGGYQPTFSFSFGAIPFDKVNASMALFVDRVMPEIRRVVLPLASAA